MMKLFRAGFLVLFGLFAALALTARPTFAAPTLILTVNSTADTDDGTCDAASCTLREAINASNASGGVTDTIAFNIPGGGVKTISPTSALPVIFDTVVIDGYTQPGTSPNTLARGDNAVLRIELDGHLAPTGTDGLRLDADNNIVRGLIVNQFHSGSGLIVYGDLNVIEGNFIGTNAAGSAARGNENGINLCSDSIKNLIGGITPGARNLISGNEATGIDMSLCPVETSGNTIQGNYIGPDRNGTLALSHQNGITISGGSHGVGGLSAASRNLISGNTYGIQMYNANDSVISANYIGTQADGKHALANTVGIYIWGSVDAGYSTGNRVGGVTNAERNRIAFNQYEGVAIGNLPTAGDARNTIQQNSIFSNGHLAIDLASNGVTANDGNDGDTGPNLLQNYPALKRATSASRLVKGKLISTASTTFTVEFFKNPGCDASQYGEGKTFIGSTTVTTNALGRASFTFHTSKRFGAGNAITATATDDVGNTSEFSKCKTAQ